MCQKREANIVADTDAYLTERSVEGGQRVAGCKEVGFGEGDLARDVDFEEVCLRCLASIVPSGP